MTTDCQRIRCNRPADLIHGDLVLCARHWLTAPEVARAERTAS